MNVPRIHTSSTGAALLLDFMRSRGMVEPELQARLIGLCEAPRMPIEVWFGLLASLQQLAGSPSVGLDVASIVQPRHVGTLGYLAVHSDNIMQALTRYCRFQGLLHNVIEFNLMVEGSELVMRWFGHEQNPAPLVSDELFLGGIVNLVRTHASPAGINPTGVTFPQAEPPHGDAHRRYFQCPVHFMAPVLSLRWPLSLLDRLNIHRDADLAEQLEHQAEQILSSMQTRDPLLPQLRHHILHCLHEGELDFAAVARRMGVGERTLYRQMHERGIRFKAELNQIRFDMARQYLSDRALSLMEIALLLGYTDQSVFTRAFRTWSGMTPQQFRRGVAAVSTR